MTHSRAAMYLFPGERQDANLQGRQAVFRRAFSTKEYVMIQSLLLHKRSADEFLNINRPVCDSSVNGRLDLIANTRFTLYLCSQL